MRILCETMFKNKRKDPFAFTKSKTFGDGLSIPSKSQRKHDFLSSGGGGPPGGLGVLGALSMTGAGGGGRRKERALLWEKMRYCDTFAKPLTVSEPSLSEKEVKFLEFFDLYQIPHARIFSVLTDGEGVKGKKKKEGSAVGGGGGGWSIVEGSVRDEEKILNFLKKKQSSLRERRHGEGGEGKVGQSSSIPLFPKKIPLNTSLSLAPSSGPLIGLKGKKG